MNLASAFSRAPASGRRVSERQPWPLWIPAGLGVALFAVPLLGLLAETRLSQLGALARSPQVLHALGLSALVSLSAVALAIALGLPLAWLLARREFPGRALLRTLVTLPMVLPPVVAGVALLAAFGPRGLLGAALARAGWQLPFSTAAAVVAAAFVSAPFAATLGASLWHAFRTVLLPAIAPSLRGGVALCWARALGEFGATLTFAGNLEGRTQTLPLAIYQILHTQPEQAFLLAVFLLIASLALLLALRGRSAP